MNRVCLILILLGGFLSSAKSQEQWDLRRCVEYALANNISIKQQDIQARVAALTYNQSKLSVYPNLNFTTNLGLNTGRSIDRTTNQFTTNSIFYNTFGVQTNVDVFNFFSKTNSIAPNGFESKAAEAGVEKLRNDVVLNVAGAYLQILLNREQVSITRIQVQQTAAQLANTRKLVQAGSVPELNAVQLEAQVALDSANVVTAKGAEAQSVLLLKALLNLDAGAYFDIVTPPVELIPIEPIASLQPEIVYQLAVINLPQQRANNFRLRAAEKSAEAARGALYPSVTLGASLQTNYSNAKNNFDIIRTNIIGSQPVGVVKGSNDTVFAPVVQPIYRTFANPYGNQFVNNIGNGVGMSISVPIFNNGIARTNLQKAKLNVRSFELAQEQDNLNLKQDIYKAYTDAVTSLEKFNASNKSVSAAERAFDFSTKRYNIGLLNTIELITTQSNLFTARIQRSLAQYDYVFKMKVLEFYKGQGLKL